MKIIGQNSIIPIFNRPKKVKRRTLPWKSYVPPDSVDVQLIPRRNLYGRSPLRFRSMGTESTQLRDAILIYQDEINPFPKDMPTQEELTIKLEEVQNEFEEQRKLTRQEGAVALEDLSEQEAALDSLPPQEMSPPAAGEVSVARFRQVEPMQPPETDTDEQDHVTRFADWVQQVTVFE